MNYSRAPKSGEAIKVVFRDGDMIGAYVYAGQDMIGFEQRQSLAHLQSDDRKRGAMAKKAAAAAAHWEKLGFAVDRVGF
nr:hypothetical protein DWF04_06145 [Cereibacter sphaeroides f. sp. denitrificans]